MIDRALQQAQEFRERAPGLQYDAKVHVIEWNGRGEVRGTADATMTVRPGDAHQIVFLSREVHGRVKLPDANHDSKEDENEKTTLQDFAREHRVKERFDFKVAPEPEPIAMGNARRIDFAPRPQQPEKNAADRFLDSIEGSAWISEEKNRFGKFRLRLRRPFQIFWIFAVLKELSIEYELIEPDEFLGRSRLKVAFWLATPIYSLRQEHNAELGHFRKREATLSYRRDQCSPGAGSPSRVRDEGRNVSINLALDTVRSVCSNCFRRL